LKELMHARCLSRKQKRFETLPGKFVVSCGRKMQKKMSIPQMSETGLATGDIF
jgi:hypothetical protein